MNNNGNHGNKFFEGFIWGAIIGGTIVFLMGTKKGKKLLKAITEEGVGNLADIIDEGIDEEEFDEEPSISKAPKDKEDEDEEITGNGLSSEKSAKPSIRKRFFKRRS